MRDAVLYTYSYEYNIHMIWYDEKTRSHKDIENLYIYNRDKGREDTI